MTSSHIAASPASAEKGAPVPPGTLHPLDAHDDHPHRIPLWLVRLELFLRVMLRMYVGIAVFCAPWSHSFWDRNWLFTQFPALGDYAALGAVRGIVSGLGLLNLWYAVQDALHHRDG